ncbi:MAG: triose-phosphate isomerase [Bdellovibrionales bacterium]
MRKKIAAANWKLNKTPQESRDFLKQFIPLLPPGLEGDVVIFPPTLNILTVQESLKAANAKKIFWGAQNCYFEKSGAFTGETSPQVLAELGARYTLVGHSERRSIFKEDDALLAKKVKALQQEGIIPMLCVGETLAEREQNKTEEVIKSQLLKGLALAIDTAPFTLAYEPVWAIGTGKVAEPHQAEAAHKFLRNCLVEALGVNVSQNTSILYGGSVTAQNARDLAVLPNIDGFLVGGASLKADSFSVIASTLI